MFPLYISFLRKNLFIIFLPRILPTFKLTPITKIDLNRGKIKAINNYII